MKCRSCTPLGRFPLVFYVGGPALDGFRFLALISYKLLFVLLNNILDLTEILKSRFLSEFVPMVYTRRKTSVKSHENAAATSTKVLKSGRGKANKAVKSGVKTVRDTEREKEKETLTLKTGPPEVVDEMGPVPAADFVEDDMEEIAAPYSSSNRLVDSPVYEDLENVRHEELLSANVKVCNIPSH